MAPTVIRLLDAEGKEVQDSISGEYEDSFSLETFEDLCKAHFAAQPTKCFIIARVQTVDPKQPSKEFYSYYNAFHLNKTLFQTQIYLKKRYIHRLHVLNPLTNSDIIGNVMYYLVKPPKIQKAVEVKVSLEEFPTFQRLSIIYTQEEKEPADPNPVPKISLKDMNISGKEKELLINMHQVQYEDISDTRQAPALIKKLGRAGKVESASSRAKVPRRNTLTSYPATNIVPINTLTSYPATKKNTQHIEITSLTPQGTFSVGETEKMVVPFGTVTRFAIPIPITQMDTLIPKTRRETRRSLSYRNAISASGVPASFLEWAKLVTNEYHSPNQPSSSKSEAPECEENEERTSVNYDVVLFTSKSSIPKSPSTLATPNLKTIQDEDEEDEETEEKHSKQLEEKEEESRPTSQAVNHEKEQEEVYLTVYDAVFFATDGDFLETSKTRHEFRNNALQPEDAKLFEMKEYTAESSPQDFEIIRDPKCCIFF